MGSHSSALPGNTAHENWSQYPWSTESKGLIFLSSPWVTSPRTKVSVLCSDLNHLLHTTIQFFWRTLYFCWPYSQIFHIFSALLGREGVYLHKWVAVCPVSFPFKFPNTLWTWLQFLFIMSADTWLRALCNGNIWQLGFVTIFSADLISSDQILKEWRRDLF